MPAKTSPDPKNTSVNNTAEATTNTDRRAFMAGAGVQVMQMRLTIARMLMMTPPGRHKGTVRFVRRPLYMFWNGGTPGLELEGLFSRQILSLLY